MYCSSKQNYYYEHRILNVTSKSLKHSSKSLLTQYIAVRHQYTFYRVQVVDELAIIKKCNVYNVIKHSHLFSVCQSTVVSFKLSQIIYNYLQKKVWFTEFEQLKKSFTYRFATMLVLKIEKTCPSA